MGSYKNRTEKSTFNFNFQPKKNKILTDKKVRNNNYFRSKENCTGIVYLIYPI